MPTIPALDFVVFYVADLDASLTYFTEILGFKAIPEQSGEGFKGLSGSDAHIGYGLNLASADTPPAGTAELYFKTDNLGELHTALTAKGAGTTPIVQLPFGSIFHVRTPDQHALVMLQDPQG